MAVQSAPRCHWQRRQQKRNRRCSSSCGAALGPCEAHKQRETTRHCLARVGVAHHLSFRIKDSLHRVPMLRLVLSLLSFALASSSSAPPRCGNATLPLKPGALNVLLIGDSISMTPPYTPGGYGAALEALLAAKGVHAQHAGGEFSGGQVRRFGGGFPSLPTTTPKRGLPSFPAQSSPPAPVPTPSPTLPPAHHPRAVRRHAPGPRVHEHNRRGVPQRVRPV